MKCMNTKIEKKCLRYIVPFVVDKSFDEACSDIDNYQGTFAPGYVDDTKMSTYHWKRFDPDAPVSKDAKAAPESDLFDYIRKEYSMLDEEDSENKVGCSWKLVTDENIARGLPFKFLWFDNEFKKEDKRIPKHQDFQIKDCGIYVFRNHLGLFWYELELGAKGIELDRLMLFQYVAKELNRNNNFWIEASENSSICMKYKDITTDVPIEKVDLIWEKASYKYMAPFSFGVWTVEILERITDIHFLREQYSSFPGYINDIKESESNCFLIQDKLYEKSEFEFVPKVPDRAILFTYAAFKASNTMCDISEEERRISHLLTNGYKASYHYNDAQMNKLMQPFADVLWNATNEGCSYIAWPMLEEVNTSNKNKLGNSNFFYDTLCMKVKIDYFHLYIRCLYQSYSLLLYAEQLQNELSSLTTYYEEIKEDDSEQVKIQKEENKRKVENLCMDINVFLAKNMTTSVSHIAHHSDFYIYLMEKLHIHADIKSLTAGLNALDLLLREQRQKEESIRINNELKEEKRRDQEAQELRKQQEEREKEAERKEKRRDDRIQAGIGWISVFAIASALTDCFDFIAKFEPGNEEGWLGALSCLPVFIAEIIFSIAIVAIGVYVIYFTIQASKESKDDEKQKEKLYVKNRKGKKSKSIDNA